MRNLSDDAYDRFKERLFAKDILPGQFVSQREISRLIGISLGPVREALLRLEIEGLVQIVPQRGIQVFEANLKIIRDTFQLRLMIEKEAVAKYAECASDEDLSMLESTHVDIVEQAKTGISEELLAEAQRVDLLLHGTMVEALGNSLASRIHETNSDRLRLIRLDHGLLMPSSLLHTMGEHLEIIHACENRDEGAATHAMEVHLSTALRRAMGV